MTVLNQQTGTFLKHLKTMILISMYINKIKFKLNREKCSICSH